MHLYTGAPDPSASHALHVPPSCSLTISSSPLFNLCTPRLSQSAVRQEHIDNLQGEHCRKLLLLHASLDKFLLGYFAILILIHLSKSCLDELLLTCSVPSVCIQKVK